MKRHLVMACLVLVAARPLSAQVSGGHVHGSSVDEYAKGLPDIALSLEGDAFLASTVSGRDGRFLVREVPPGTYRLTASGEGLATLRVLDVRVPLGRGVEHTLTMKQVRREEKITILAEDRAVDRRQAATGAVSGRPELDRIPRAIDAWSVLPAAPGLVDERSDADGSAPPAVKSRGARPSDTLWYVDGVDLPPATGGALPRHAVAIDEIAVATGGHELRHPTSGGAINLVQRRGSDRWRGSARGSFAGGGDEAADHVDRATDYGVEVGGPVADGSVWFWGAVGREDVRAVRLAGGRTENRTVTSASARLDWQATAADRVGVLWTSAFAEHLGRRPGDQPVEPDSATWDQHDGRDGLRIPGLVKVQDHHAFSPALSLTARYAHVADGIRLDPRGGLEDRAGSSFLLGRTFGSTRSVRVQHAQHTASFDGSWLFPGHDLRLGLAYRRLTATEETTWPGGQVQAIEVAPGDLRARVFRGAASRNRVEHWSAYLGDSVVWHGLVASLGLRYDHQGGRALPGQVAGNSAFPGVLPSVSFEGDEAPFTWSDVSPRLGLAYALDAVRRTIARVSLSRYTGRLGPFEVGYASPTNAWFAEFPWNDRNGDRVAQDREVVTSARLTTGAAFAGADAVGGIPLDVADDFQAPRTTEIVVAFEREVRPGLAIGLAYTHQRHSSFPWQPRLGRPRDAYLFTADLAGVLPDGAAYRVPAFVPLADAGRILVNRPGYHQTYDGWELQSVRRLSDGWMLRLAAGYNSHREFHETLQTAVGNPTPLDSDPLVDGGQVAPRVAGGDTTEAFLGSRWTFSLSGLWRLPGDMDLAGHLLGRQGLPQPLFRAMSLGADGPQRVLVAPRLDTFRYGDLWTLDLRLSRALRLGRGTAALNADVLNLFDRQTVLVRNRNLQSPAFGEVTRTLSPRLLRLGLQVSF